MRICRWRNWLWNEWACLLQTWGIITLRLPSSRLYFCILFFFRLPSFLLRFACFPHPSYSVAVIHSFLAVVFSSSLVLFFLFLPSFFLLLLSPLLMRLFVVSISHRHLILFLFMIRLVFLLERAISIWNTLHDQTTLILLLCYPHAPYSSSPFTRASAAWHNQHADRSLVERQRSVLELSLDRGSIDVESLDSIDIERHVQGWSGDLSASSTANRRASGNHLPKQRCLCND